MTSGEFAEIYRKDVVIPQNQSYKRMLIDDILDFQGDDGYTRENLQKMSIKTLERIYDNC